MKKVLITSMVAASMMFVGCGSSNSSSDNTDALIKEDVTTQQFATDTSNIVPAIENNITLKEANTTIKVKDVLSFDQISEMLGVPYADVKFLNPQYKKQIIPPSNGKEYFLRLPKKYIGDFIDNETALYNYKTKKGIQRDKLLAQIEKAKSRNFHIVRSGENLGVIAKKYRCYISQLKRWNKLRGNTIYPGQKLIVYGSAYSSGGSKKSKTPVKRAKKGSAHIVKYGENLALIAKKYKG